MLVHVQNTGLTVEMVDGITGKNAESVLRQRFLCKNSMSSFRIVEKASNKELRTRELLENYCTVNISMKLAGGKGGFGSNLRSTKTKGSSSKTYYRDLKTGATVGDLERLKKAKEILEEHSFTSKQETDRKKEKLAKSIEYYQSLLDSNNKKHLSEDNQKLLEEVDEILEEMKDSMNIALFSDDERSSESDDDEEEDDELMKEEMVTKEPSYKHFFD